MKLRVKVWGTAYVDIPKDIAAKYNNKELDFDDVVDLLIDDISEIDCGDLRNIDSECKEIV